MTINTSSGSKIYIGSNNTVVSNPLVDTYILIGFVANMGEFGRVYSLITFDSLGDRNTLKFKGQRNDGKMSIDLGRAPDDSGQAACILARDVDQDFNFKVSLNDASAISGSHPTFFYFLAKVMSYTTNVGGPTQIVHAKMDVEIKSNSITEIAGT